MKDIGNGDGCVDGRTCNKNCNNGSPRRLNARAINEGYMCELERIDDTHFDDAEMHSLLKRMNTRWLNARY